MYASKMDIFLIGGADLPSFRQTGKITKLLPGSLVLVFPLYPMFDLGNFKEYTVTKFALLKCWPIVWYLYYDTTVVSIEQLLTAAG
jgi:hypothetical protein